MLKDFHCGKKGLITLLKIKVLPYDVLKSEEWSANILFAEEELAQLEGTPLNKIATINPERIDLDFIENDLNYQYIDLSCIDESQGLITEVKTVKGKDFPARARLKVKTGDILLATVRPEQNNIAIVTDAYDGSIVNNTFAVVRPESVPSEWLYFLLRSNKINSVLTAQATGSSIPTLKIKQITDLKIPIPENGKQVFTQAKDLFNRWQQHHEMMQTMDEVAEEQFLQNKIVKNIEKNEREQKLFHILPYEDLEDRLDVMYYYAQELYFEWLTQVTQLEKIVHKIRSGVAIPRRKYTETGLPYIRIRDLSEGKITNGDLAFVNEGLKKEHERNIIHPGEILISRVGTIGRAAIVSEEYTGALVNQHISIITVDETLMLPEFLMFYLNTEWAKEQLEQRSQGTGQRFVNAKSILEIDVPLPPVDVQERIVQQIEEIIQQMDPASLEQEIAQFIVQLFE